jgi:hypothetical protein
MKYDKPLILSFGVGEYVTVYGYDIDNEAVNIEYKYTGELPPEDVNARLELLVTEAYNKELGI